MFQDHAGHAVSGANADALALFETAFGQLHCYVGNPLETAEAAIAAAPDFAMAHLLRAHIYLSGMEAAGIAPALQSIATARRLANTERETLHTVAAEAWAAGRFESASDRFDDILIGNPRDSLALQMGHLLDFYRGDARNLRDRVLRVMPAWSAAMPHYHAVLGMLAFGLEETADYTAAEAAGRRACELNPRDAWAHHAVLHVMEMQGRVDDGIRWATAREPHWAPDNGMAVHNWWHLMLYYLERDDHAEVLRLYDTHLRGNGSTVVLELIDASAMLWRLHLRGVEIGKARWNELALAWSGTADDGVYAFNDVHALIAYLGAGRDDLAARQMEALHRSAERHNFSNAAMTTQVGLPAAKALIAFMDGQYQDCIASLRSMRTIAHRFGGSHAQRDLLDLTLIEAARRAEDSALLRALVAERLHARPKSPLALRYLAITKDRVAA
ncbi:MAG: tetratricopeptide repeat protein [Ferrovibrio sp.]